LEFDPPISTRETDELIEIANYIEKWDIKAVEQAKKELEVRGISKEHQSEKVKYWNLLAKEELEIELGLRKEESYDILSLIFMLLKWPFTMLSDWHLKEDGYLRMYKQRRMTILSGIAIWIFIFGWASFSPNGSQAKWQKEVDNVDISEWEKEFISDEDINQNLLDKAIKEVENNQKQNIRTVVIINSDTSNIEQLKMVKISSLTNISYTDDFDPNYILIIEVDTE